MTHTILAPVEGGLSTKRATHKITVSSVLMSKCALDAHEGMRVEA